MANYYTHFTVRLPLAEVQGKEAKALLDTYCDWVSAKIGGEDAPEGIEPLDLAFFERIYNDDFEDQTGLTINVEEDEFFLSDDAGEPNLDLAGEFISALLDRFDIDEPIGLEWGCTCSRPLPGGFGGGAAVIKRDGIEWMNTNSWLNDRIPGREEPEPATSPAP